jgi:hypothetical protein
LEKALCFYVDYSEDMEVFPFEKIFYLYVLEKLLQTGDMSLDEGKGLLSTLEEHYHQIKGKNSELIFLRKMGVSTFLLVSSLTEIYFEKNVKVVLAGEEVETKGALPIEGDCEEEKFELKGGSSIGVLLNAGTIDVKLYGSSRTKEIGGEKITVTRGHGLHRFFKSLFFIPSNQLITEGDRRG